jgi:L-ascorbate metabolism protein UlaG (beta-lactamase superfamily)
LKVSELEKADLVFITHAHQDHFSPNDLQKILKDHTIIIVPPDISREINRAEDLKQIVEPNKNYEIKGFKFQTIPAYNTHPDKLNFHPKTNNWVGYIFELNGKKIYHAGDTDFIDEMKRLKDLNLDVAMLPIGGKFTMEVEEAAEAANTIAAKITIPMHYRSLNPNNYQQLEGDFKKLVTNSEVVIMKELK